MLKSDVAVMKREVLSFDLIGSLIHDFTGYADTVVDCHDGSGFTASHCLDMGRTCVSMEAEDQWFEYGHHKALKAASILEKRGMHH